MAVEHVRTGLQRAVSAAVWTVVGAWALWCVGALAFAPLHPAARVALVAGFLAVLAAVVRLPLGRWRRHAWLVACAAVTVTWLALMRPSSERPWVPELARQAHAALDSERLVVRDVRNARWRSATEADVVWEERSYDLAALDSVWFVVEPFSPGSPAAHTFVSFGFADGRYLAISVEARREVGEPYSILAGLFRRYELAYVVGDERDLIGVRAIHRGDEVYLHRAKATSDQARRLLVEMLARGNALAERPEFYHTLGSTCTTNIVSHINRIWPESVPLRRELLFPGSSDRLAFEVGLLEGEGPYEALRERARVDGKARLVGSDDERFSQAIREGRVRSVER